MKGQMEKKTLTLFDAYAFSIIGTFIIYIIGFGIIHAEARNLWAQNPKTLAKIEYVLQIDLQGVGRCKILNTEAIHGNGTIITGQVKSSDGKLFGHIRAIDRNGSEIDLVAPGIPFIQEYARITVKDYVITGVSYIPGQDSKANGTDQFIVYVQEVLNDQKASWF